MRVSRGIHTACWKDSGKTQGWLRKRCRDRHGGNAVGGAEGSRRAASKHRARIARCEGGWWGPPRPGSPCWSRKEAVARRADAARWCSGRDGANREAARNRRPAAEEHPVKGRRGVLRKGRSASIIKWQAAAGEMPGARRDSPTTVRSGRTRPTVPGCGWSGSSLANTENRCGGEHPGKRCHPDGHDQKQNLIPLWVRPGGRKPREALQRASLRGGKR